MKKIIMFLYILSLFAVSCKYPASDKLQIPEKSEIFGLASIVNLNVEQTVISMFDFFAEPVIIDSVRVNKNLDFKLSDDKSQLTLDVMSDSLPKLSVMTIYADGYGYSILLKKSNKTMQELIFDPKGKEYETVYMKGEMNAWNYLANQLEFDGKKWRTYVEVEPGNYQYLFVVDGVETLDRKNKDSISNGMGAYNSVLNVGKNTDADKPYLYTISFTDENLTFGIENKAKEVIVFYQNHKLPDNFVVKTGNEYTVSIPKEAKKLDRSYIRVWSYNKSGVSNDLYIPLTKGKVVDDATELNRSDYESAVMYNVFIDRFYDGDETNNRPLNSKEVLPQADFHGGDIAGIIDKINDGYFEKLGVNTLWISPIVKNVEGAYGQWPKPETKFSAYHGYWPMSFTQIDDRFGTHDEFKELVELAHEHNLNVILDFVAHHVHEENPIYKQHPDWATDLYLPDGTLNTERWDDHRLTTWFDVFLPTLDNSKPEVYNMVSDSALYWITEFGIDGFRHDAAKHVPLVFWSELTKKVKNQVAIPQNRKIYQIGETYGSPELIGSYVNSGMLDAQFDFNLYDAVSTAISVDNSFKNVEVTLNKSFKYYGYHNLMGNITGNQDRGRFISYATGTLKYDEDAKLAGWTRDIIVGSPVGYDKMAMLITFINTVPGIPVIYYGDEIGIPGGNDPDNRRMMRFDDLDDNEHVLKDNTAELIKLRRSSMPLMFGDFKFIQVTDDIMIYQRTYFGQIAIIVFNKSDKEEVIIFDLDPKYDYTDLKSNFACCFSISKGQLQITLEPESFEVFTN
ncbi:MAG: hypothetical protein JXL97_12135 [Bacteroidales bacterium]|nr:hypothetical protein [Bacteroidales bacterium]